MTTAVSICSVALQMLGVAPISNFDEGTDVARMCGNLYPNQRDAVLRAHPWNCAVRRIMLSPLADRPPFEFALAYQLPGDWIRTLRVGTNTGRPDDFRQEGRQLLSNSSPLLLRYVWRNENESTYDEGLIEVLTARMKWMLTYPVTKSTSLRDSHAQEYLLMLKAAKSTDSMDEPGDMIGEETPLIQARY